MIAQWNSINPVWGLAELMDIISSWVSGVAPAIVMSTFKVHLFTAGPSPLNMTALVSDFTEATFTGYVTQTIQTPTAPTRASDGAGLEVVSDELFQAASAVSLPNTVVGYYVTDVLGTTLILAEYLTPVNIVNPGDGINLKIAFPLRSPATA